MKTIKSNASLFIAGFILMAFAHMAIQCDKFSDLPDDDDTIITDNKDVEKAGKSVENAFLSGDPEKVKKIVSPAALGIYSDLIENSPEENLKAFGEAFKTREMKALSEKYAEFKFTVDGKEYTIAMTMDEKGEWKIMRL